MGGVLACGWPGPGKWQSGSRHWAVTTDLYCTSLQNVDLCLCWCCNVGNENVNKTRVSIRYKIHSQLQTTVIVTSFRSTDFRIVHCSEL